jgi:hypothetical protein
LQKERGVIKKSICSRSIEKNVLQSKSIEKKRVKHDPLQNKSKRRISKQGVFRKTQIKYSTHALLDQVA